jgi:hypothetical protein
MPNPTYTLVLWELHNISGPFPVAGPGPPAGFVWVVRDVLFHIQSTSGWVPAAPSAQLLAGTLVIAATPAYRTVHNVVYETRDCRQTVAQADALSFVGGVNGWDLRVTGYQLSA